MTSLPFLFTPGRKTPHRRLAGGIVVQSGMSWNRNDAPDSTLDGMVTSGEAQRCAQSLTQGRSSSSGMKNATEPVMIPFRLETRSGMPLGEA
jgi:hypothetical protein